MPVSFGCGLWGVWAKSSNTHKISSHARLQNYGVYSPTVSSRVAKAVAYANITLQAWVRQFNIWSNLLEVAAWWGLTNPDSVRSLFINHSNFTAVKYMWLNSFWHAEVTKRCLRGQETEAVRRSESFFQPCRTAAMTADDNTNCG